MRNPWIVVSSVLIAFLFAIILYITSATFSRNIVTIAKVLRIPVATSGVFERGGRSFVIFDYPPVELTILTSKDCTARICKTDEVVKSIRLNMTPALRVFLYDIGEGRGKELAEKWKISSVPTFAFNETVTRTETYPLISDIFDEREGLYFLRLPSAVPIGELDPKQKVAVSADDDPSLGPNDAKVTVIEFSDFQCPFCRRHATQTLPLLKEKYIATGKIRYVFRDFPLSIHNDAQKAAEASECAQDQDKFWEMHDKIFEGQNKRGTGTVDIPLAELKKYARELRLNLNDFNQCLDSGKYASEVQKDIADGTGASVDSTPTFFVNGEKVEGAVPFSTFESAIERALSS